MNPARLTISVWGFALGVVRHPDGRFLIVQETPKHNMLYWLPGGRTEFGDSFYKTCIKETKEEGGIQIEQGLSRMRFIFLCVPSQNPPPENPKTIADEESNKAMWVSLEDLSKPPIKGQLRGSEPNIWFNYVSKGLHLYPLTVCTETDVDETTLDASQSKFKADSALLRRPAKTINQLQLLVIHKGALLLNSNGNTLPCWNVPPQSQYFELLATTQAQEQLGLTVELLGIVNITRTTQLTTPQAHLTITLVATLQRGTPADPFCFTSLPTARLELKEPALTFLTQALEGYVSPMTLLGIEGHPPPTKEDIRVALKKITKFQKSYKMRSG